MTATRVKCLECDNLILPQTAQSNGGLCAPCAKISPAQREASRRFDRSLASGKVFRPTPDELNSATGPIEIPGDARNWKVESGDDAANVEYAEEAESDDSQSNDSSPEPVDASTPTVVEALAQASTKPRGDVYFVTADGARLNLAFNERYGICDYQNAKAGEYRYAFTSNNAAEQVAEGLHLVQSCPCCGVGMLWYPSRFHLPRAAAFEIASAVISGRSNELIDVRWLAFDDISYTRKGRG